MFDSLQKLLGGGPAPADDPGTEAERLRLATTVLLLEVAYADDEFSDVERANVRGTLARRFELDESAVDALLDEAEAARRESGDLYRFARLLNDGFSRPRLLAVVELLWDVVYSDGELAAYEDAVMKRIGKVLGLRHEELMALKVRAKRRTE